MDCSAYPNRPCGLVANLGVDFNGSLHNILGKGSCFFLIWRRWLA